MQKTFVSHEMFYGSGKEEKTGSRAGGGKDVEVLPTDRIRKEYM